MINDILDDANDRMGKTILSLKNDLAKIRTGRAHPNLLSDLYIDYYGVETPVSQASSITVLDARTLGITPWDKILVKKIEKAIINSDLGLNPVNLGDTLRIPLPPLNEQRRKELVKLVKSETEKAKVAIRNIRRDSNSMLKELLKDKEISEDEEKKATTKVQTLTNNFIKQADNLLIEKEKDLMSF